MRLAKMRTRMKQKSCKNQELNEEMGSKANDKKDGNNKKKMGKEEEDVEFGTKENNFS